jgi:hypothetical protein
MLHVNATYQAGWKNSLPFLAAMFVWQVYQVDNWAKHQISIATVTWDTGLFKFLSCYL